MDTTHVLYPCIPVWAAVTKGSHAWEVVCSFLGSPSMQSPALGRLVVTPLERPPFPLMETLQPLEGRTFGFLLYGHGPRTQGKRSSEVTPFSYPGVQIVEGTVNEK